MELYDIQRIAQLDNERLRYETASEILEGILGGDVEPGIRIAIGDTVRYLRDRIADIDARLGEAEVEV